MKKERRDFLKLTTVGATGLVLTRPNFAWAAWPSSGKLELNPDISNMRVVACVDPAMMKSTPTSTAFATQNAAVDYAKVQANMDAMAMTLTNKSSPDEAWRTIFHPAHLAAVGAGRDDVVEKRMHPDDRLQAEVLGNVFDAVLGELQLIVVMGLGILGEIDVTQVEQRREIPRKQAVEDRNAIDVAELVSRLHPPPAHVHLLDGIVDFQIESRHIDFSKQLDGRLDLLGWRCNCHPNSLPRSTPAP